MNNKPKILVVGSLVMDMIVTSERFSGAGETVFGSSFSTAPGGKGANQAVQASRLGADVTMVGMVGDDDFGRAIVKSLNESGVDTTNVFKTDKAATAIGNVQIQKTATSTENRITVVGGANNVLSPSDVEFLADSIGEYDMVILQNEIPTDVNIRVVDFACAAGVPVMLNPAPYTKLPAELVSRVSYISPNEHEALDMTGLDASYEGDRMTALTALRSLGVENAMITLGKNGCIFYNGTEMVHSPCACAGEVIDPTAAGDSFVGAFCTAIAANIGTEAALRFANYTAGITVCGAGAQPSLPTLDRVLALLRRDGYDTAPYEVLNITEIRTPENAEIAPTALDNFISVCSKEFDAYVSRIDKKSIIEAANLILESKDTGSRLHITGIGKPSHVANYIASLISSTGTPTYFLHGTEAVHGSCGQLVKGDVVICISNSGETAELKATAMAIRNNGCKVIAVGANNESWLGKFADVCIVAGVAHEGGALNRAPRASILAETFALQCLSVLLQERSDLTPEKYVTYHPGGTLGKLRDNEK